MTKIDKARKWKLRESGESVTILTVTAPHKYYPVIGYTDYNGQPMTWTAEGRNLVVEEESPCDLVPDDGAGQ